MPFFIRDVTGNGGGMLSSVKFVQIAKRLLRPEDMEQQVQAIGLDPNRALQKLDGITSARGIKAFFTINPRKSWESDLKRLPAVRKGSSLRFLPLRDGLLEYVERGHISENALTLSFDPHPSPLRHTILAQLLSAYFLEIAS
jgi:hypothetical protein